ncbi:MAG: response regulator [Pseudomonadales bacterium]
MSSNFPKVLLVEDDPNDVVLFRRLLVSGGLEPDTIAHCSDLAAALAACEEREFDVVLLDLTLPDSSGIESVDRFVAEQPELPVVVLTGDGNRDQAGKALRIGAEISKLEQHLAKAQRLEGMEVLAGGVAHDFNNLLVGIMGNASMALAELPTSSEVRNMIAGIERSALAAAELTRQMLAYAGKGRFVVEVVDLSNLIADTEESLRASINENASIRFDSATEPLMVRMDATQIQQILMNLVMNASEALDGAQGSISVTTGRTNIVAGYVDSLEYNQQLQPGDYAFLEVTDSGKGMDEATKARIFDPFFSTKFAGRGLGLAASLGIARGHAGAVRVYSELDQGTSIKLFLPLSQEASTAQPTVNPVPKIRSVLRRLLIADDNEAVRQVARRALNRAGYDVVSAADGLEAVKLFKTHSGEIDAVLLDMTMPNLNGEATCRELRQLNPAIPIIMMSGYNEQEVIRQFSGRGLAGFLQKPFMPDALIAKVDDLFDDEPE